MAMDLMVRWKNLWWRLGITEREGVLLIGEEVIKAYSEPTRFYHTKKHLEDVLSILDWAKMMMASNGELSTIGETHRSRLFDTVEMALWYHDVVYKPEEKNNEERSRELFLSHAQRFKLPEKFNKNVADLIDLTAHHMTAKMLSERLMADCDLSILGADSEAFRLYDKNIRLEYRHIAPPIYVVGRKKILKGFLKQNAIFKTRTFHEKYEATARKNLTQALEAPTTRYMEPFYLS